MTMMHNTDGYKTGHPSMLNPATTFQLSNLTPRRTRRQNCDNVIFFGEQYFIKKYLIKEFNKFFKMKKRKAVRKYYRRMKHYLNDDVTVDHIAALHDLGYLPLSKWALPEGTAVPYGVPCSIIFNTHKDFAWLVTFLETIYSTTMWLPSTSATTIRQYQSIGKKWIEKTAPEAMPFLKYMYHDFSMRGMPSLEAAKLSGAGFLLFSYGTDTVPAIDFLEKYYNANCETEVIGHSVYATEHSVMCTNTGFYILKNNLTWEKYGEAEKAVFKDLLIKFNNGILSIVSDTWNLWTVLTDYINDPEIKDLILNRDGKTVFRPDSGNPVDIVCGLNTGEDDEGLLHMLYEQRPVAEQKGVVELLDDCFGHRLSSSGHKILNEKVGVIYGEAITLHRDNEIGRRLAKKNYSVINCVKGIGSFSMTGAISKDEIITRDLDGWAVKSTYAEFGDMGAVDIFKDPITSGGKKTSAKGMVAVFPDEHGIPYLKDECTKEEMFNCMFREVFRDGKLLIDDTLENIRARAEQSSPIIKNKELV